MSNNNINSVLQRKLSPGLAYSKLIEKSTCKVTSLGSGDTFHSIDKIKEYSLKYQGQTKAIADRLVKNSLKETVNSFYKFCYDHFQYKADGLEQNIKSPACAWHSRKEGMDCKSFSVLASTLCSNAGIKHYIRKIKQPFFHPDEFTHVYVIIPINQNTGSTQNGYFIIDGTTHDNQEAIFIEKHDTFMDAMPHYGLNAPQKRIYLIGSPAAQKALNSCGRLKPGFTWNKGGKSVTQHIGLKGGIGLNGADTTKPYAAFCNLAKMLNEAGVPKSITSEILKRLRQHVNNGIDPIVAISAEGIIIEGEFFRFQQPNMPPVNIPPFIVESEPEVGSGLGMVPILPPGSTIQVPNPQKKDGLFDGLLNSAMSEINDKSDGWLQNIFSKITGFFSCIGASATPKKTEAWVKNAINPWVTAKLGELSQIPGSAEATIAAKVNGFSKDLATIRAKQTFHSENVSSSCSKKSNKAMADYIAKIEQILDQTYNQMKTDYTINETSEQFLASKHIVTALGEAGKHSKWNASTTYANYKVRSFKLKPGATGGVPTTTLPSGNTGGNTGGGTGGNTGGVPVTTLPGNNTGGTFGGSGITPGTVIASAPKTTNLPSQKPQNASMNVVLIALLAGGFIFGLNHFKNQPNKK